MRQLERSTLPAATIAHLNDRNDLISAKPQSERKAESDRLWSTFRNSHSIIVRRALRAMASGLERCMYCEDGQGTTIDHYEPRAVDPAKSFSWTNMLLACSHCNSNQKRDHFPTTADGSPLLIDPTTVDPRDHLAFALATAEFEGTTPEGDATIEVCGLNRWVCVRGRANALVGTGVLCVRYAQAKAEGDETLAADILQALREYPFASVWQHIVRTALDEPELIADAAIVQAILSYPELQED